MRHGDPDLVDRVLLLPIYVREFIFSALSERREAPGITAAEYRLLRAVAITLKKIKKK